MSSILIPILVNASLTCLVALALQIIMRATGGIVDFATGQYVILAGLTYAYLSSRSVPLALAIAAALAVSVAAAVMSELLVVRPLQDKAHGGALEAVVATAALLFIWEQVSELVFGDLPLRGEPIIDATIADFAGIRLIATQLLILVIAAVVVIAIARWLSASRTGRTLRAIGDNSQAAELMGLRTGRSRVLAFAIAGVVAGVAGVMIAPLAGLSPTSGTMLILSGFVALFLGGIRSPFGVVLGALVLEALKLSTDRVLGSGYQDYAVLLIALLVFAFRPQGLISGPTTRVG